MNCIGSYPCSQDRRGAEYLAACNTSGFIVSQTIVVLDALDKFGCALVHHATFVRIVMINRTC